MTAYTGVRWRNSRNAALARDGRRCQDCGTKEHLHVHHITPVREFDNPEDAHYLDNLTTLCKYCHPSWEGEGTRPVLLCPSSSANLVDVVDGLVTDWIDRNWPAISPEDVFTTAVWHDEAVCNNCFSRLEGRNCRTCGSGGAALPETDSQIQVAQRLTRIAERLGERNICADSTSLRRAARRLKSKEAIQGMDREIYDRATKVAVRRALDHER